MFKNEVPNLTTAVSGPLYQLEKQILENQVRIETWFRKAWQRFEPSFYASVDLRNAGFKLAPVDTNLFPAGFNNLNPDFIPLCIHAVQTTLERIYHGCQRVLIIPESHTRNTFYLENLFTLQNILEKSGFETRIGSLLPDLTEPLTIDLTQNRQLILEPIQRQDDYLTVAGFKPCIIILNNDLSDGIPALFQNIKQPVLPPLKMGWAQRLKSDHFSHYQTISREFSEMLAIDPWLITPIFRNIQNVDFQSNDGMENLLELVNEVFLEIEKKYQSYGIQQKPFVVVKADNGTYGMGVLMLHSVDDLKKMNRKARNKMSFLKGGQKINKVIIQEGVYTFETIGQPEAVAEPVIYMIGRHVVGGFYRVHTNRGADENLNAPGMHFEPLAFAAPCNFPTPKDHPDAQNNRFYAYGVVARLALLAAAWEIGGTSNV